MKYSLPHFTENLFTDWCATRPDTWRDAVEVWASFHNTHWVLAPPQYRNITEIIPKPERMVALVEGVLERFPEPPPADHGPEDVVESMRKDSWFSRETARALMLIWYPDGDYAFPLLQARKGVGMAHGPVLYTQQIEETAKALGWSKAKTVRLYSSYVIFMQGLM